MRRVDYIKANHVMKNNDARTSGQKNHLIRRPSCVPIHPRLMAIRLPGYTIIRTLTSETNDGVATGKLSI